MRIALTLAAGVLLCGLGAGSASAAPAMPAPGVVAGDAVETVGRHHRGYHRYRSTSKMERRARRYNTMRYGNPNARNPERPGYQQQLGNTTNGPRY